jgi:hypothetical protein
MFQIVVVAGIVNNQSHCCIVYKVLNTMEQQTYVFGACHEYLYMWRESRG